MRRTMIRYQGVLTVAVLVSILVFLVVQLNSLGKNVTIVAGETPDLRLPKDPLAPITLSPSEIEVLRQPGRPTFFDYFDDLKVDSIRDITLENMVGGMWPSGKLFINLAWKRARIPDIEMKVDSPRDVQLIMGHAGSLYLPLKDKLASLGDAVWEYENQADNAFLDGRSSNMNQFKPGVKDIKFVFSDIGAQYTYWFPWFDTWRPVLQPLIDEAIGPGMNAYIGRMQMARMINGAEIKKHVDSGGWPSRLHRIHIPIMVPPETVFEVFNRDGVMKIPIVEGSIFELNNRVPHQVNNFNTESQPRVHLIIDVADQAYTDIRYMKPGQHCVYDKDIVC